MVSPLQLEPGSSSGLPYSINSPPSLPQYSAMGRHWCQWEGPLYR